MTDVIDYSAKASLVVWTSPKNALPPESGALAALVSRAMALNQDPGQTHRIELSLEGVALGFGLIEAIHQRPDFPRDQADHGRTG